MTTAPAPHIPARTYLKVFAWLTAFTVTEVAVSYLPLLKAAIVATLVTIATIKAILVVLYYMHLKFDSRWYALVLIVSLFFALLFSWALFKF